MPQYQSRRGQETPSQSGVPLGGIGAGTIQILPDGTLDRFTIFNNWETPVWGPNAWGSTAWGKVGNFFIVRVQQDGKSVTRILSTFNFGTYPGVDLIDYEGTFPKAVLKCLIPDTQVEVTLEAWSSFIPGDYENSSLPAAVFDFRAENKNPSAMADVSIVAVFRNMVGTWNLGRYNEVVHEKNMILFKSAAENTKNPAGGTLALAAEPGDGRQISYLGAWNVKAKPFWIAPDCMKLDAFEILEKEGRLPDTDNRETISGERFEYCGALCSRAGAGEKPATARFVYAWHMPNHPVGHRYEKKFFDAGQAALYVMQNAQTLKDKTGAFSRAVGELPVDGWMKDALMNNAYVLFTSSWYGRKGEFSLYEAPGICPLMGTLDVNFYASVLTNMLYPKLEAQHLRQFFRAQRPDGYIPHDLGRSRINCPSDGTTSPPRWKDLNSKFILMCLNTYQSTRSKAFLEEAYPHCKKALEWLETTDRNGDGLPDNEGQDQTFDDWPFYGTNAYTAGLFLAALQAMEHMAGLMKDEAAAAVCRLKAEAAQKQFIAQLWTGEYFMLWKDAERGENRSCTCHQLNGQWYANLLGLGYILPEEMVKTALKTVARLNTAATPYGAANSVGADGKLDRSSPQSGSIWPGECYAISSLLIQEGMMEEGLRVAQNTWKMICAAPSGPWNQADNIDAETAKYIFGDHYLRSMAVWALVRALAGKSKPVAAFVKKLRNFRF